jgi:hypothetical protein
VHPARQQKNCQDKFGCRDIVCWKLASEFLLKSELARGTMEAEEKLFRHGELQLDITNTATTLHEP